MWSILFNQTNASLNRMPRLAQEQSAMDRVALVAIITAVVLTCGCQLRPKQTPNFSGPACSGILDSSTVPKVVSSTVKEVEVSSPSETSSDSPVAQASYQTDESLTIIESISLDSDGNEEYEASDTESSSYKSEASLKYLAGTESATPVSDSLNLESVLATTAQFYPEIEAAIREFEIAQGAALEASGNFDTKLKASSENTPVGFYETYRSNFGIEQPTFNGGSLFAGYRFGRGDIEPWYLERNTNELGELKLGANWTLLRGREIDSRRVAVWQANLKRASVEPSVLRQLIRTLRDAEVAYWNWVAAGQMFQLNEKLLAIAKNRVEGIEERIKAGDLAEITRTDNDRAILSREVKLLKAKGKLASAAIKLSLFYRDTNGTPLTPTVSLVPKMVQASQWEQQWKELDSIPLVASAMACRPEIQLIGLEMKALSLDIAKARNDFLPQLNAQLAVSQDFGDPTSASAAASSLSQTLIVNFDEKDQFQVDASLSLSQSLQRRKASGKVRALTGKLQQLRIKRAFLKEKIAAEVEANYQLTAAANEQIQVASRSLELAQKLSDVARDRYQEGDVDLFEIILREKQELDSAVEQIESAFSFYVNRANLDASVGCIDPEELDRLLR